jgi:hypothetical protein
MHDFFCVMMRVWLGKENWFKDVIHLLIEY